MAELLLDLKDVETPYRSNIDTCHAPKGVASCPAGASAKRIRNFLAETPRRKARNYRPVIPIKNIGIPPVLNMEGGLGKRKRADPARCSPFWPFRPNDPFGLVTGQK